MSVSEVVEIRGCNLVGEMQRSGEVGEEEENEKRR